MREPRWSSLKNRAARRNVSSLIAHLAILVSILLVLLAGTHTHGILLQNTRSNCLPPRSGSLLQSPPQYVKPVKHSAAISSFIISTASIRHLITKRLLRCIFTAHL